MVRSLPRPSAFADVDAQRIAGNTLVLLLHGLAFALLLVPTRWNPPAVKSTPIVVVPIPVEEKEIKPTLPPPDPKPVEIVRPRTSETPVQVADTPATDNAVVLEQGSEPATESSDAGPVTDSFETHPPGPSTLAYDVYPAPRYPRQALRDRLVGTVVLKVRVDEQGRPQDVQVERSSGHRVLDRAAREQVLARWRFHPAQREGRAVPAWGLVPIEFTLP